MKKKLSHFFQQHLLVLIALVLTFLTVQKLYFVTGFPYTHDGENHLARFANYKVAVKEGQIPPRFAPNLMNHYGYPVFNYNYPLANIASLPFSTLDLNYQLTFKILAAGSFVFGLIGVLFLLQKLNVHSTFAQAIAVVSIGSAPFVGSMFYHRGNIGEIMAWSLLSWLLWAHTAESINTTEQDRKQKLLQRICTVLLWSLFFLSHNVTVLFGTAMVVIYMLLQTQSKKWLIEKVILLVLGILTSLWFWLPALAEKSAVILDGADVSQGFTDHFATISQLITSSFTFGFSRAGSIDDLTLSVGAALVLGMIAAVLFLIKKVTHTSLQIKVGSDDHSLIIFTVASALLLLFQHQLTQPIWEVVPLARFIQFPWRLGLYLSITLAVLVGLMAQRSKRVGVMLAFLALIQLLTLAKAKPVDYFSKQQIDYDLFAQSTSTNNENLPKEFTYQQFSASWQPEPTVLSGDASATVLSWTGSKRSYQLDVTQPSVIVEPTMYFPGWETVVTLNSEGTSVKKIKYINSEDIAGRIGYQLEPGSYTVKTVFTQNTLSRRVGNTVSLLTIVGLIMYSVVEGKRVVQST